MEAMENVFFVFALSFAAVLWGGKILPLAVARIAALLRASEFLTTFFLVAAATSIPELFIGITAAAEGVPGLSLGNVMGANFLNVTLVIAIAALFGGVVEADGRISHQNLWIAVLLALFPLALASDGLLSRTDGAMLIVAFGMYLAKLLKDKQHFHKFLGTNTPVSLRSFREIFFGLSHFAGGCILLLGGALFLTSAAQSIVDRYFDTAFVFFGFVFVALGTTLPELVFALSAAKNGQHQAVLGNTIGSMAFNAGMITGIVALIRPVAVDFRQELFLPAVFLTLGLFTFTLFISNHNRIGHREARVLLLLYLAFAFVSFIF